MGIDKLTAFFIPAPVAVTSINYFELNLSAENVAFL
jgi:hypothetical protein